MRLKSSIFRPAAVADLLFLADVCESVIPLYDPLMPGAFRRQAERYRSAVELPSSYMLWVIEAEGEKAGFLGMQPLSSETIYLVALYLHAGYQHRGIGGTALEEVCRELKSLGYRQVLLSAHKGAFWAVRFYERHRFTAFSPTTEGQGEEIRLRAEPLLQPHTILMKRDLFAN